MRFNSVTFLVFFPLITSAFFMAPKRLKAPLLLVASYMFYMLWKPAYGLLIAFVTVATYCICRTMAGASNRRSRRLLLLICLIADLLPLLIFKYLGFALESLNRVAAWAVLPPLPVVRLILPVGISFYTFQALAYAIDVYRGRINAEENLLNLALYVSFFPQLVAGPIERAQNLLPQIRRMTSFDEARVASGIRLMTVGFAKKLLIADRLAVYVNAVYGQPTQYRGLALLLATYLFAFQIYYDFSAYTDIARGSAKILGFDLILNFKQPYLSASIGEFWRRWHISLSSWFRDYLYIPLGGNRVPAARWAVNIVIAFLVSGLWHGAGWTFLVWSLLHGMVCILERLAQPLTRRLPRRLAQSSLWHVAKVAATFHIVLLGWIFFRARSLAEALYILKNLGLSGGLQASLAGGTTEFILCLLGATAVILFDLLQSKVSLEAAICKRPAVVRYAVYLALPLLITIFGAFESPGEFVYFQF